MKTVTIVGGGIAGLAAATCLAEAGFSVTVVEERSKLGGRASSVYHVESGEWIDNCQHILLACCTSLLNFYKRLGVDSKISFYDEFLFMDPMGNISRLKGSPLPSPFHLFGSLLRLRFLNFKDKRAILRALAIIAMTPQRMYTDLEKISFEQWLIKHHQTENAVHRFWSLILVSALNEDLDKMSAKYAFMTFKEAFFRGNQNYRIGVPNVPLSDLYSRPALEYLSSRNGQILFQQKADRVELQNQLVTGILLSDGTRLTSDYYVLAVPFQELLKILPQPLISENPFFKQLSNFKTSPITGIHLFFDRTITDLEQVVLLDSRIQWVFNKTKNFNITNDGKQYLQLVISASREFIPLTKNEAVQLALKELERYFPIVREAKLLRSVVVKELNATFSPLPDSDSYRPTQQTPIENLWLSGDWTKTDWPSTMESAVRSGDMAAEDIILRHSRIGDRDSGIPPQTRRTGVIRQSSILS